MQKPGSFRSRLISQKFRKLFMLVDMLLYMLLIQGCPQNKVFKPVRSRRHAYKTQNKKRDLRNDRYQKPHCSEYEKYCCRNDKCYLFHISIRDNTPRRSLRGMSFQNTY